MKNLKFEDLTTVELQLLSRMNERALKIAKIEKFFNAKKVPIDTKYLDSLSDKELNEIFNTHCNE